MAVEQEIRFAVVIYGGVSLAVYINGVAQEILRMVRSTAGCLKDAAPQGSEKIYRKLAALISTEGLVPDAAAVAKQKTVAFDQVRTRFIVDILSGTSAGGINAIFLAKALANNQSLDQLAKMWIDEADIDLLLNDNHSLEGPLSLQDPPQSLLNSERMYFKLLKALDDMDPRENAGPVYDQPPLVDTIDLFSTATDLNGVALPIALADQVVYERRFRNVFHFRRRSTPQHRLADALSPAYNDFLHATNPFLAFAARCTSAFPFAFQPMALCDIANVMNARNLERGLPPCGPDTRDWQHFYKDYIGNTADEETQTRLRTQFQFRPFGDGGYLDNKPFSYAIDTILSRKAALPVDRKLLYIEPAPENVAQMASHTGNTDDRPDAIQNSLKALIELPRYETIREDLQRLIAWNSSIRRMTRIRQDVRGLLSEGGETALDRLLDPDGLQYRAYLRMRLSAATDSMADRVSQALGVDPDSARGAAVRILAGAWRKARFRTPQRELVFLRTYDLDYIWRALHYLYQKTGDREELSNIHEALNALIDADISELVPGFEPLPAAELQQIDIVMDPVAAARHGLASKPPNCDELTDPWAQYVLDRLGWRARIDALHASLRNVIREVRRAHGRALLREMDKYGGWRFFRAQDVLLFPMQFETNLGETGEVDILRVSPADARAIQPRNGNGSKLKGVLFGAFGGFLDRTWRYNDMLWGRLDGAERLITAVLPSADQAALRSQLIEEAQFEIAMEWERGFGRNLAQEQTR